MAIEDRLSAIAVSGTHGEDSPYFAGWKAYDENPYDEVKNRSGVIQMGLAENQVRKPGETSKTKKLTIVYFIRLGEYTNA